MNTPAKPSKAQTVVCLVPKKLKQEAQAFIYKRFDPKQAALISLSAGDPVMGIRLILSNFWKKTDLVVLFTRDLELQRGLTILMFISLLFRAQERVIVEAHSLREKILSWPEFLLFEPCYLLVSVFGSLPLLLYSRFKVRKLSRLAQKSPPSEARWLSQIKRILYLKTDLNYVEAGGSVGHVAGVANAFAEMGYDLSFISAADLAGIDKSKTPVHVVRPHPWFRDNFTGLLELAYNEIGVGRIFALVEQIKPDLVYQRYSKNNYLGVILSTRYNVPFILEYNGSFVWMERHWGKGSRFSGTTEAIEMCNLLAADLIVVVSKPMKDELVSRGIDEKKILVNPNGVDATSFHPEVDGSGVRRAYGLGDKQVVGFIGTFGPWHGAEVLAKAIRPAVAENDDLHFLFVGDGVKMDEVRSIISKDGVGDFVTFTGLVPQSDAPRYLAACDILASPHVPNPDGTPFFGSPTKLFEYMAMGKAIVASDLEQIGEILRHQETAWMVRPGDATDLAHGILCLAQDAELRQRLGAKAREEVVARYTWQRNVQRVLEACQSLVGNE